MIHLNKSPLCWLLLLIDEMLLFSPALMMQSKYLWKWSSPAFSYLFRIINLPILNPCVHVYSVCRLFAIPLSPDHSTCSDSQNSSLSILITQRLRDFLSQWTSCPHNENLHKRTIRKYFRPPRSASKTCREPITRPWHSNFEPLHSNGTRTHTRYVRMPTPWYGLIMPYFQSSLAYTAFMKCRYNLYHVQRPATPSCSFL